MGLAITSYSANLRRGIVQILKNLGFSPTNKETQTSVFLRRQIEIDRFFKEIGTSNDKHLKRYLNWKGTEVVTTGRSRKPLSP